MEIREDGLEILAYDFKEYPIYIRRGLLSAYPDYCAASHWHEDVELILILEGEMTYQVNGALVVLRKGEGIFVNSGQLHFGYSPQRQECDFWCIVFHPSILCGAPKAEYSYVFPVTKNVEIPYVHLTQNEPWQKRLLKLVAKTVRHKEEKEDYFLSVLADFLQMWDLLYTWIANPSFAEEAEGSNLSIVKAMVVFVQENYSRDISLAEIAEAGSVGQSKCCKLFGQYLGKSPVRYVNAYRLNRGALLLRQTNLPVTEIALRVGYGGVSYFTECFRKHFGQRPLEYRKRSFADVGD